MELTEQDLTNALVFLERVDLKGKESLPHAELCIKLAGMRKLLQERAAAPPAPPIDPPTDEE